MTPSHVVSDALTRPQVPLSHAVIAPAGWRVAYLSGIHPYTIDRQIAVGDFARQTHQVFANMKSVLAEVGSSLEHILKTTVILQRIGDFAAMNDIYRSYFPSGRYPARSTIQAALAREEMLLEIECVAAIPETTR